MRGGGWLVLGDPEAGDPTANRAIDGAAIALRRQEI